MLHQNINTTNNDINNNQICATKFFSEDISSILHNITDSLKSLTYIVDPYSYDLLFTNTAMQKMAPKAIAGAKCYESIRDQEHSCENCPIREMMLLGANSHQDEVYYPQMDMWANVEFFKIHVNDREAILVHCHNITEQKTDDNLNAADFTSDYILYNALTNSTDDYIYMCDMSKNLFYFPQAMVEEFNLPGQIIENAIPIWGNLIHENERPGYFEDLEKMLSGVTNYHYQEYRAKNKDGQWIWLRCRGYLERDVNGVPTLFAGVITYLGKKSKIDHMSGLLNKYEFENDIRLKLESNAGQAAILILGLDNFKYINNLYGWDFGDDIIRLSAQKIQSILPPNISTYRLDGDMFGIIIPSGTKEQCSHIYKLISTSFQYQQELNGHRYYCTISGGGVVVQDEKISFYTLFKRGEYALEYSKQNGKNRLTYYNHDIMSAKDRSINIINLLRESIDKDFTNFEIYYQPQVNASTCSVEGAEALLRWYSDEFGEVSPVEFIPLLEQTGLIHPVGRWVLDKAAETCAKWRTKHDSNFSMSVNVSYLQLLDKEFIPYVNSILQKYNLPNNAIHLEITESCIASSSQLLSTSFKQIRELGIIIEMDDFGTGYSSLEILKNHPSDIVKIDRAFVKDITKNDFDATFIKFVVALCHSVNIKVCLEGVEQWEEYNMVNSMGLDIIQGYLFGVPQSQEVFESNCFDQ